MTDRINRLRALFKDLGVDGMLVSAPENVRYLSSFSSPDDGMVLITPDGATLLTDGRYTAQAAEESTLPVDIAPSSQNLRERAGALAGKHRMGVESEHVSLKAYSDLSARFSGGCVGLDDVIAPLRLVKDEAEISALREAARITDLAYQEALKVVKPGVTEVEVALTLERVMRVNGAESGFDIIVASGTRGAMPHGVASQKRIEAGELVTLDFGAAYQGYHADMTRTVAIGEIGAEERRMFDAVLESQKAAVAAVAPGKLGSEVDAVARNILAKHNLADGFVHSLGHGTGLRIHEGPRLSAKSGDVLKPGMIVTVEPGVYYPGFTGLRIEDLVLVTDNGHEVLSHSPKEFLAL